MIDGKRGGEEWQHPERSIPRRKSEARGKGKGKGAEATSGRGCAPWGDIRGEERRQEQEEGRKARRGEKVRRDVLV